MSTQAQDTTVRSEIVVDAPAERAFAVFTEQFDRIKPREHNLLAVEIAETVFEAHEGGRIYDRGVDGSECAWARVLAFEPPRRLVFSWDIGPTWQVETDRARERGRGPLRRRDARADPRGARAPPPRAARPGLGERTRRCPPRAGLAALPAALPRAARILNRPATGALRRPRARRAVPRGRASAHRGCRAR